MDESYETELRGDPRWKAVQRIIHSPQFSRALQLRSILEFIASQAIRQPEEPIHEFDIAYRVLGRRSNFNPVEDNIVRVQVARLRKRLDAYYATEGKDEPIGISIALGSYKPTFIERTQVAAAVQRDVPAEETPPALPAFVAAIAPDAASDLAPRKRLRVLRAFVGTSRHTLAKAMLAICATTLIARCAFLEIHSRAMQARIDVLQRSLMPPSYGPTVAKFWADFLGSNPNTDIVLGDRFFLLAQNVIHKSFTLNDYVSQKYVDDLAANSKDPAASSILKATAAWGIPSQDHATLAQRIETLNVKRNRVRIYYAREFSPDLVNQDSVILLGSRYTNPWANLVQEHMNFVWNQNAQNVNSVQNRHPESGEQSVYSETNSVGYCVIAYFPNPSHQGNILLIEGTNSKVTEAGGEFLLSEDRLIGFQHSLHTDQLPYFEILLKTMQVRDTPLSTSLVAYRIYPQI